MSYAVSQMGAGSCCPSCEQGGPCTGCGGIALGAVISEQDCRAGGGDWDPSRQECRNLLPNQCSDRGGVWDDAAQICRGAPGISEQPVDELCAERGGEYDYRLRICYKPGNGGSRQPISMAGASPSRAAIVAAGAIAVAAGWWWWRSKR